MGANAFISVEESSDSHADQHNGVPYHKAEFESQDVLTTLDASQSNLGKLQEYIRRLQIKAQKLEALQQEQAPSRHQILYRIVGCAQRKGGPMVDQVQQNDPRLETYTSKPYFDHPEWVKGLKHQGDLQCNSPIQNLELFLEKNKDISFTVYKNFDRKDGSIFSYTLSEGLGDVGPSLLPQPSSQSVRPVSEDLRKAVGVVLGSRLEYGEILQRYRQSKEVQAPYLFLYHSRADFDRFREKLSPRSRSQLDLLFEYVIENFGQEFASADLLLAQGKITPGYVKYLFKPGDVLIQKHGDEYRGFVATSWPRFLTAHVASRSAPDRFHGDSEHAFYNPMNASARFQKSRTDVYVWEILVWSWAFDGNFQRHDERLDLEVPTDDSDPSSISQRKGKLSTRIASSGKSRFSERSISDLNIFPIKFAPDAIIDRLRRRGRTFWTCCDRRLVSYQGGESEAMESSVSDSWPFCKYGNSR